MRLIMFDMDGTLVNSSKAITNTINYVRENTGLHRLEDKYILEHINKPEINSAEFFMEQKSLQMNKCTYLKTIIMNTV